MQDVKLLTDKYRQQGLSLEEANNRAYREAHASDTPVEGGSQHLNQLAASTRLTLIKGQLVEPVDVKLLADKFAAKGLSWDDACNRAYLCSIGQGAPPELYNSPDSLSSTSEELEEFLIRRQREDKAKHDRDQSIATKPKPTFDQCLADVQREFPKLLPSRQFRLAADLLGQRMLPPGGETDMNSYNGGSAA